MQIVAVDIGGTHARFVLAGIGPRGIELTGEPAILRTADHAGLREAWQAFAATLGQAPPPRAAIAVATAVVGDEMPLTNGSWVIRRSTLARDLGVDEVTVVNDFAAVAHAVARVPTTDLQSLAGPELPLPADGVISIVGAGTGLGVAQLFREAGRYHVLPTEGGHCSFAPQDEFEDALLQRLRQRHARVSIERVVSGPGLLAIYETVAALAGREAGFIDDKALWQAALAGSDALAVEALQRFCLCLGSAAGDFALAQGADAIVIAGGLGARLRHHLPQSGFAARLVAKGRFEALLRSLPVKLIVHPQPGLYGAAAAFAVERPQ